LSRLDSAIRRLQAQRECLAAAARLIRGIDGPVLELGLGNGRTYDHLRSLLPEREIFAFDRAVNAHPACVPDDDRLVLGEMPDVLAAARDRIGAPAALAHCDVGTGDEAANAVLAYRLGPALDPLLAPGAVVLSDRALVVSRWYLTPLPPAVEPGRYFMYRVGGS
jgi:hypothetical protein